MQHRQWRKASQGFTVTEIVFAVAVGIVVLVLLIWGYRAYQEYNAKYTGAWSAAPATISPAPGTGTFVYHVSRQLDAISPATNAVGRSLKFDMSVTQMDGKIVSCNGTAIPSPGKTCTADTDANGNVTIIVSLEQQGQANLVATDVKSKAADPPQAFSAP